MRWNATDVRVVYAPSTLALAALEYLVHVDPDDSPSDLVAVALKIPADTVVDVESRALMPADWRAATAPDSCGLIGADWISSGASLGLDVPSVITPGERNLLLNRVHADSARSQQPAIPVRPSPHLPRLRQGSGTTGGTSKKPPAPSDRSRRLTLAKSTRSTRAGDGTRTRDIKLGRLALYQLSYSRVFRCYPLKQPAALQWWGKDSNLRRLAPTDLQSVLVGHLSTPPGALSDAP